ncbi:hypothetical protein QQS21_004147 [Conoideocrella luteorostrata]|uniref:Uncharacterized protein n=1 Tax=Conoideocrella luteorostrata TaxID=1105319 RepID=A0AAJ0CRX6_9HYPO|nr:hypothetical protein QQS21_004147 [Conoideocrella luteorostrata]
MNDTSCPAVPGYKHNGDCNLICKPTEWTDIVTFFLGNYAAHAATVIGRPGQSTLASVLNIFIAVCLPGAGVLAGIQAIASRAVLASTELKKATRAGALCIVVKGDSRREEKAGGYEGLRRAIPLQEAARSSRDLDLERQPDEINSPTLDKLREELRSKGVSERYSLDGAVGRISTITEAKVLRSHAFALEPIGTLPMLFRSMDSQTNLEGLYMTLQMGTVSFLLAAVPIVIVGAISGFKSGSSSTAQRIWTLIWLLMGPPVGVGYGILIVPLIESRPALWRMLTTRSENQISGEVSAANGRTNRQTAMMDDTTVFRVYNVMFAVLFVSMFVYTIPAFGGFVMVGVMLKQYGTCVKAN